VSGPLWQAGLVALNQNWSLKWSNSIVPKQGLLGQTEKHTSPGAQEAWEKNDGRVW
jgi:hypothetical protein